MQRLVPVTDARVTVDGHDVESIKQTADDSTSSRAEGPHARSAVDAQVSLDDSPSIGALNDASLGDAVAIGEDIDPILSDNGSSGFLGVSLDKRRMVWRASLI